MPKYLEFRDIPDCSAIAKRISRSLRKLGHGKGFGQERYIVDINGFTQLLFGITRHEYYWQIGIRYTGPAPHGRAIHLGNHHVGNHQIYASLSKDRRVGKE